MDAIEVKYRTPTFKSATYSVISRPNRVNEEPSGTTAAMISEGTTVSTGARKKTVL